MCIGVHVLCTAMINTFSSGCISVYVLSDLRYPLRFLAAVLVMCNMVFVVSVCIAFPLAVSITSLGVLGRDSLELPTLLFVFLYDFLSAADPHYLLLFV